MKIETKQVFVADDGNVFITEEACLEHESNTLEVEFDDLLSQGDYYISDAGCSGIIYFTDFKRFVNDNRAWVLYNCLNFPRGEKD